MTATQTTETTVTLTRDENDYIVRILQNALAETRVEVHRTHTPKFRDRVLEEETLIRGLLTKLDKSA